MTGNLNMLETETVLNIASIANKTAALGPGNRSVVWVQGCHLNCPGCIAPDWIPFLPALKLKPSEIVDRLDMECIDGLTLSGGEPMEQAAGLAELVKLIRKSRKINTICFTGYRYERLVSNPPNEGVSRLLNELDVLIDGPYIRSMNNSVGLRGSTNQRIIHLTDCLALCDLEGQGRNVEVRIQDGEMSFIGIPTVALKSAMDQINKVVMERSLVNERL